ncbi:MAG: PH domain-containing protein [Patescibacteria group bacterium]|nr:PH domain-containing protein [Patescibacteria group bacterium]
MTKKLVFSTQNEDEIIIKVANRHPITLIRDAIGSIILFVLSFSAMLIFFYVPYVLPLAFLVFVFSIIGFFYSYFTWSKDKYIITDQRIVDMDQQTLFAKSQKEAFLDKIQDVVSETKGFLGAIFKYGNVDIQTASETSLTLDDIADPDRVQKIISNLIRNGKDKDGGDLIQKMTEMIRNAVKGEETIN